VFFFNANQVARGSVGGAMRRPRMAPPYVTSDVISLHKDTHGGRLPFAMGWACEGLFMWLFFLDDQIVGSEIPFPGTQFSIMEFYAPKFYAALRTDNENTPMNCLKIVLLVNRICS